jgi:23S rRNA pseudouridine1911/1915/1917 synthase
MDEGLAGLTVEQVLMRVLHLSKTQVKRAKFREDGLILDGVRVFSSHRVAAGQTLLVRLPEKERSLVEPVPGPVEIVYEDQYQVAVKVTGKLRIDNLQENWSPKVE